MGRAGISTVVMGMMGFACAHSSSMRAAAERPALTAGKYAVESIRSRASLDGVDQVIEISESGTRLVDGSGSEHLLTERGALVLGDDGSCRLALAVSVDGEEPGISDRSCTWRIEGDSFLLGDQTGQGTRTVYQMKHGAGRLVLEGVSDIDGNGKVIGDAKGERIVLTEQKAEPTGRFTVDRTSEEQAAVREIQEMLHEL